MSALGHIHVSVRKSMAGRTVRWWWWWRVLSLGWSPQIFVKLTMKRELMGVEYAAVELVYCFLIASMMIEKGKVT